MQKNDDFNPRMQMDFYRDAFRRTLFWITLTTLLLYVLIGAIIYTILFRPSVAYYANTSDGQIFPMPSAHVGW